MSGGERRWRARLLSVATAVQTGTAATLGSVLVTHLAAPVVAALVGPEQLDLANQTMVRRCADPAARPCVLPERAARAGRRVGCTDCAPRRFGGAPCAPAARRLVGRAPLVVGAVAERRGLRPGARAADARLGEPRGSVGVCAAGRRALSVGARHELRRVRLPCAAVRRALRRAVCGAHRRDGAALDRRRAENVAAHHAQARAPTHGARCRQRPRRRPRARHGGRRAQRRRGSCAAHAAPRTCYGSPSSMPRTRVYGCIGRVSSGAHRPGYARGAATSRR